MKLFCLLFLTTIFATAQNKKIDFFGTEFLVNNKCEVKQGQMNSVKYGKSALIWADAPPEMVRNILLGTLKDKIKEKKVTELKNQPIKIKLLKQFWKGNLSQYQKEKNDTITTFVNLFADYKNKERLLIIVYQSTKKEKFRIPAYFDFLIK
jgi:hypothetical protein